MPPWYRADRLVSISIVVNVWFVLFLIGWGVLWPALAVTGKFAEDGCDGGNAGNGTDGAVDGMVYGTVNGTANATGNGTVKGKVVDDSWRWRPSLEELSTRTRKHPMCVDAFERREVEPPTEPIIVVFRGDGSGEDGGRVGAAALRERVKAVVVDAKGMELIEGDGDVGLTAFVPSSFKELLIYTQDRLNLSVYMDACTHNLDGHRVAKPDQQTTLVTVPRPIPTAWGLN